MTEKYFTGQLITHDSDEQKLKRRLAMTHEEHFF